MRALRRGARAGVLVCALAASARADEADDARALGVLAAEVLAASSAALGAARAAVLPAHAGVGVVAEGEVPERFSGALARALCDALNARGEGAVVLADAPEDVLAERARAAGAQRVLRVGLRRETAGLSATLAVLRVRASAWETFLREEPAPVNHPGPVVALRLDSPLRARFAMSTVPPWPARGLVRARTIPTPFRDVVALAFGRLGTSSALAVLSTESLRIARIEARTLGFVPRDWPLLALGPTAVPARQPLGAMTWDASGIRVRTSAQRRMGTLRPEGEGLAAAWQAAGDAWPSGDDNVAVDALRARVGQAAAFPANWRSADGALRVTCDGTGGCVVQRDTAPLATLRDVAPPVLLDDLDDDGVPELVTASAAAPDAPDRVRVFTLRAGALVEGAGVATAGRVLALAAGDTPVGRSLAVAFHDPARGAATLLLAP